MNPGTLDLPVIWRGCVYQSVDIAWTDDNDDPIDLTGWTPRAYSRFFQFNVRVNDSALGLTSLSLPQNVTRNLNLGVTNWDWIWVKDDDPGTVSPTFLKGNVEVKQPTTDPNTHVEGRVGGGSVYLKMFRGDLHGERFVSLVGRYHQDSDNLNLVSYPVDPPVLIRPRAQDQMAQMFENSQTKIEIFIHFFHAYLSVPLIANRIAAEYVSGIYLIPFNPSGVEGDVNVTLTTQQQTNLLNLLEDIKATGFTQLTIKVAPASFANTGCWYNNSQDCDDNPGVITWNRDRYLHNKNYILSIFRLVEAHKGDLSVVYDLGAEHANNKLKLVAQNPEDQPLHDVHRQYCRFLWGAFVKEFGWHHSTAYSVLGGQFGGGLPDNVPIGYAAMLDLFRRHGLPFPGYYGVDFYGNDSGGDPDFTDVYDQFLAVFDYTRDTYPGEETRPFILQETFYNDGHVALQLERALGARPALNLHSIFQFPILRGFSHEDYYFPEDYPMNYFNYHTL